MSGVLAGIEDARGRRLPRGRALRRDVGGLDRRGAASRRASAPRRPRGRGPPRADARPGRRPTPARRPPWRGADLAARRGARPLAGLATDAVRPRRARARRARGRARARAGRSRGCPTAACALDDLHREIDGARRALRRAPARVHRRPRPAAGASCSARPGAPRASVADAVTASCSIPWVFRPVEIGGREYVDGGAWSLTNLDVAPAGRDSEVLCLNPSASLGLALSSAVRAARARRSAPRPSSRRSRCAPAARACGRSARTPTAAGHMGANFMDPRPARAVHAAGYRQGLELAARHEARARPAVAALRRARSRRAPADAAGRVLVFTRTEGFRHDSIPAALATLRAEARAARPAGRPPPRTRAALTARRCAASARRVPLDDRRRARPAAGARARALRPPRRRLARRARRGRHRARLAVLQRRRCSAARGFVGHPAIQRATVDVVDRTPPRDAPPPAPLDAHGRVVRVPPPARDAHVARPARRVDVRPGRAGDGPRPPDRLVAPRRAGPRVLHRARPHDRVLRRAALPPPPRRRRCGLGRDARLRSRRSRGAGTSRGRLRRADDAAVVDRDEDRPAAADAETTFEPRRGAQRDRAEAPGDARGAPRMPRRGPTNAARRSRRTITVALVVARRRGRR